MEPVAASCSYRARLAALTDFIAGRRPMSEYDGMVKEWQASGGDAIRTEFQQAIAASA